MSWATVLFALVGSAVLSALILAMVLRNPRLMLQDYPRDVRPAVPPKTAAERRETALWSVVFLTLLFGLPLAWVVELKLQEPGLPFWMLFLNAFAVLAIFNLIDWLVLDWLVFCTLTPRFAVLPGTEGMSGYKDYGMHFRGFLIGLGLSTVAGAIIGLVTSRLPL